LPSKVKKLVLVTSKAHPLNKHFTKIARKLAEEFSTELEVREEDYMYLIKYGDTDELGMAWVPQLLAELDSGEVIKVLTQPNLNSQGNVNEDRDLQVSLENIRKALTRQDTA